MPDALNLMMIDNPHHHPTPKNTGLACGFDRFFSVFSKCDDGLSRLPRSRRAISFAGQSGWAAVLFVVLVLTNASIVRAQTGVTAIKCVFNPIVSTGSVNIDLSAPNGTVFGSYNEYGEYSAFMGNAECFFSDDAIDGLDGTYSNAKMRVYVRIVTSALVPSAFGTVNFMEKERIVYESGWPGLGIFLVSVLDPSVVLNGTFQPHVLAPVVTPINGGSEFDLKFPLVVGFYYVKTGDIPVQYAGGSLYGVVLSPSPLVEVYPSVSVSVSVSVSYVSSASNMNFAHDDVVVSGGTGSCVPLISPLFLPVPPPNIPTQVMPSVFFWLFNNSVGMTAGEKDFDMQFNDCANLSQIRYRIKPYMGLSPGSWPWEWMGLLPLLPPSTASGFAVQVLAGSSAVPIGGWQTINTSSSSYTQPMQVRYYQTETTAVPGTVRAAMTILFEYQ